MNKKILILVGAIILIAVVGFAYNRPSGQSVNFISDIIAKDVEYFSVATSTATPTAVKGYFVRPSAKGDYPGVVMIHENRGLRPEILDTAENLAKEGYMVLAVDLLGGVAEDQTGARALTANFNQQVGVENMRAAVAFLREQGADKIASLGWCFGGRQSVELAISGEKLDATVVYYGGNMATSTTRLAPIKWPVLGIFGDQDQAIPLEMVNTFERSLNTLGVDNEIYIYPGVGHAFANPSGPNHAPNETKDAWNKTLNFLNKYLKGISTPLDQQTQTSSKVAMGKTVSINGVKITLNSVVQDNRCPIDVQCIEAGAITANVTFQSGAVSDTGPVSETRNMASDEVPLSFGQYRISIEEINPPAVSTVSIKQSEYIVTFKVEKAD